MVAARKWARKISAHTMSGDGGGTVSTNLISHAKILGIQRFFELASTIRNKKNVVPRFDWPKSVQQSVLRFQSRKDGIGGAHLYSTRSRTHSLLYKS